MSMLLAAAFAGSIVIPTVEQHDQPMPKKILEQVCEDRVAADYLPCVIVELGDKVCFAFLNEEGVSSTVHCFPRDEVTTTTEGL